MKIGIQNGHIVVFNETLHGVELNASMRGIILDSIEETDEEIVPYYNTGSDGIYFKASEVPPTPSDIANKITRDKRRGLYSTLSDPITNNISVLRDRISQNDFASDSERQAIDSEIADLFLQRKAIREGIVSDNPLVQ
ncbi:MAG: hypothetical protein LBB18_00320 [Puniceicoccales bacterium]|jgi:hypothetical protein|nr:hypothetical protein [Puniceicoccales bacterium]